MSQLLSALERVLEDLNFLRYSRDVDGNVWSGADGEGSGDCSSSPSSMIRLALQMIDMNNLGVEIS